MPQRAGGRGAPSVTIMVHCHRHRGPLCEHMALGIVSAPPPQTAVTATHQPPAAAVGSQLATHYMLGWGLTPNVPGKQDFFL